VSSEADVPMTDPEMGTRWSRREMLKKSAVAGGVALWAIPAVEVVGTKIAAAAGSIPATCTVGPFGFTSFANASITFTYTQNGQAEQLVVAVNGAGTGFTVSSGTDVFGLTVPTPTEIKGTIPSADVLSAISVTVSGEGTETTKPFSCTTEALFVLTS
jgi:hypothetical protein